MKLFTKDIDKKLFAQYPKGSEMGNQMIVAKIFNPYGGGTWYLMNSDPKDPNYLWGIVDLFAVEMGSISREELESVKVPPFNLPLERDKSFKPIKAKELWDKLMKKERYVTGGAIPGGSGWGKYKKGKRVLKMKNLVPGKPYLTYSKQFTAKNIAVIIPQTTYMFSPDFFYMGYVKPDDLSRPRLWHDAPFKTLEIELQDNFQNYDLYEIKGYNYTDGKSVLSRAIKAPKAKSSKKKMAQGGKIGRVKIEMIPSPQVREYIMFGEQSDFATDLQKNKSVLVDVSHETKTSYNISLQIGQNRYGTNTFEFPGIKYLKRDEYNYFEYERVEKFYPKLKSIAQLEEQIVKTLEHIIPNLNIDVLTLKIYKTNAIETILEKSGETYKKGGETPSSSYWLERVDEEGDVIAEADYIETKEEALGEFEHLVERYGKSYDIYLYYYDSEYDDDEQIKSHYATNYAKGGVMGTGYTQEDLKGMTQRDLAELWMERQEKFYQGLTKEEMEHEYSSWFDSDFDEYPSKQKMMNELLDDELEYKRDYSTEELLELFDEEYAKGGKTYREGDFAWNNQSSNRRVTLPEVYERKGFWVGGKQTKDEYRETRPSPSVSASTQKDGTRMRGNDGKMYRVVENVKGHKRWYKLGKDEQYKKGGKIDMNKHIWEGWTVGSFIEELEPTFDMIMDGRSWQEPFTTKEEVKRWCMDNQPYYKKYIPGVVNYFWSKVEQRPKAFSYAKGGGVETKIQKRKKEIKSLWDKYNYSPYKLKGGNFSIFPLKPGEIGVSIYGHYNSLYNNDYFIEDDEFTRLQGSEYKGGVIIDVFRINVEGNRFDPAERHIGYVLNINGENKAFVAEPDSKISYMEERRAKGYAKGGKIEKMYDYIAETRNDEGDIIARNYFDSENPNLDGLTFEDCDSMPYDDDGTELWQRCEDCIVLDEGEEVRSAEYSSRELRARGYAKGGKITNRDIFDGGYIIEHWASDVGGSNQSIDNVIEYPDNGKTYLVVSDFDQEEPLYPDNYADEWDGLDETGKFYAKGGVPYSKRFFDIVEYSKDGTIVRKIENKNTYEAEDIAFKLNNTNPVRRGYHYVKMEERFAKGGLTMPTIGFKTAEMKEAEDRDIKRYKTKEKIDNTTPIVGGLVGILLGVFLGGK